MEPLAVGVNCSNWALETSSPGGIGRLQYRQAGSSRRRNNNGFVYVIETA